MPAAIAQIVLTHHERFDGQGYPEGIRRTEIPAESRILQVADAFDAITSVRPYQPALPVAYAVDELRRFSGTQFDPEAVDGMIELIERCGWAAPRDFALQPLLSEDIAV